ncbi:nicotinate (nicotinamide) nucleotide adenylyltransferase [Porphyromonas cangingivalis]|uniref:nicotinate (nicotinamide) nucleotide adenylyltransferase n=1 Tax=Porphyromonas cangingivalis TaxID=36874 RepID=UPI002431F7BD|nr:nicotinate (nicotinamide) nucleotide adenylyltransferase [Porphyromonas cangingivalis]
MAKHIVLFSGSFNPMHIGHLCLANYVAELHPDVDEVWLMVTPANPFKSHTHLLDEDFRVRWASHQIGKHPKLKVSTIELSLPRPSYTFHTLKHLREQYPDYKFTLLMGMDSLETLPRWYEGERLIKDENILIYPRLGHHVPRSLSPLPKNITVIDAPIFDISATEIRSLLHQGHRLPYFLNMEVTHPLYIELIDQLKHQPL